MRKRMCLTQREHPAKAVAVITAMQRENGWSGFPAHSGSLFTHRGSGREGCCPLLEAQLLERQSGPSGRP